MDPRVVVAARELTLLTIGADVAEVGGLACRRIHGIDEPWATQARCTTVPTVAALSEATAWLAARGRGWTVVVPGEIVADPVLRGLRPWARLPVMERVRVVAVEPVAGLTIRPARTPEEFLAAYGVELAPLVTADHLADPAHHHLVGELHRRIVGCALTRILGGTAYVSAVTVPEPYRGRRIGTALSAAAGEVGVRHGADLVWLEAAVRAQPIYQRLGFEVTGEHVQLQPILTAPGAEPPS